MPRVSSASLLATGSAVAFSSGLGGSLRGYRDRNANDHRCKLIFSKCKNLSYARPAVYLDGLLQDDQTRTVWPCIDVTTTEVGQHGDSIWPRMADVVASATGAALELNR